LRMFSPRTHECSCARGENMGTERRGCGGRGSCDGGRTDGGRTDGGATAGGGAAQDWTTVAGSVESAPKPSVLGARPAMTSCAPSAAIMAPLSVHSDSGGTR